MSAPRPWPVRQEEIEQLPHHGKIAYAARCVRIAWDLLPPDRRAKLPTLEQGLRTAERCGAAVEEGQWAKAAMMKASHGRDAKERALAELVRTLRNNTRGGALAAAVRDAVETAIAAHEPATGDRAAAACAYEAYHQACSAAEEAAKQPPCPSPDVFLREARRSLEQMLNDPAVKNGSGAVGPEYFTS